MGGIVCAIHRSAVLRFEKVPVQPTRVKAFDTQMRQLLNVTTIAEAIGENHDTAREVCFILAKPHWRPEDREKLLEVVEYLYEPEEAPGEAPPA